MRETLPPRALRVCAWLMTAVGGFIFTLGVVQVVHQRLVGFDLVVGLAQPTIFLDLALLSIFFATRVWAKLVRQTRVRNAAKGYQQPGAGIAVPLVMPQPIADTEVLPLPTTIRTRPRWQMQIALGVALLPVFVSIFGIFAFAGSLGGPDAALAIVLAATLFGILVYAMTVAAIATAAFTRLEVSVEGISLHKWDIHQQVAWDDKKLFALVGGEKHNPAIVEYELSGTDGMVRWNHRLRPTWYAFSQAEQPFEVYDQQMRALLQLIAARTSLALYDVR